MSRLAESHARELPYPQAAVAAIVTTDNLLP